MSVFPRRGEILLATFPGDDKDRPAVVVSLNARNERANSIMAVPITTDPRPSSTHVKLPAGEGGLHQDSVARCENVATLPKSWMRERPLGPPISAEKMQEIERAIMQAIGIPLVERLVP